MTNPGVGLRRKIGVMSPRPAPLDCTFVTRPQSRRGGDYLHRARWPAEALAEHVPTTVVQLTHPQCLDAMAKTRVLMVGMVIDADLLRVIEQRRARGLATIFEVSDDFTAFPESLPLHDFYKQPRIQSLARELCRAADAVQFSSPHLEEKFADLNPVHTVFHNQAWSVPELSAPRSPAPLQVGWGGSSGHQEDTASFAEALAASFRFGAQRRFQSHQVRLELMTSPSIAEALTQAGLRFQRRATGNMNDYWAFVESLDVGLAHVSQREFALGRSDGKFIEYASRGVVAVCSRRGTYAQTVKDGETGFCYSTPEELSHILRSLHQDRSLLQRVRHAAHAEMLSSRNHRSAARQRFDFYQQIAKEAAQGREVSATDDSPLALVEGFHEPTHDSETAFLSAATQQNDGQSAEALAGFFSLTEKEPESYRAWDALAELYRRLGLTDHLPLLERTARDTKARAFERAFS